MYDSKKLNSLIIDYMKHCNYRPTRMGLARWLGISHQTISNVINGTYNGFIYTQKPHCNRCINNDDFELIRAVFAKS